jgi:hypothetical protein
MKKYFILSLIFTVAVTLVSCSGAASTEISGTWKKPGFKSKKFNNILVVAISNDLIKRSSVESAMVNELKQDKIKSSTSSSLLDVSKIEKNEEGKLDSTKAVEIKKKISDAGYDGVLIISLLDVKEKTEYVPGTTYYQPGYYGYYTPYYYHGFYNYYYNTYNTVSTPGYYVDTKHIYIDTRLFDLESDDLCWAANSETIDPNNINEFSSSLAYAVVGSLISAKVVK